MTRKIFTPLEATKTLPLVRTIVDDILGYGRQLRDLVVLESPTEEERDRVAALSDSLKDCMAELESLGCYYKGLGFDEGLVDFPSHIDGELVWLCWRAGEEKLEWYHGFEEGFAGRKKIPAALLQRV